MDIRDRLADEIKAVFADQNVPKGARDLISKLLAEADDFNSQISEAETERDEATAALEAQESFQIETLREVQYWMLGPLVYGMPMRDPRKILLIVERALDP